jgi:hypothetical protein
LCYVRNLQCRAACWFSSMAVSKILFLYAGSPLRPLRRFTPYAACMPIFRCCRWWQCYLLRFSACASAARCISQRQRRAQAWRRWRPGRGGDSHRMRCSRL